MRMMPERAGGSITSEVTYRHFRARRQLCVSARKRPAVASSAGKKVSIASSETVTSAGVPNTVVVVISESRPASVSNSSGTNISLAVRVALRSSPRWSGNGFQFGEKLRQDRIAARPDLAPQAFENVRPPLREVGDPGRDAAVPEAEPQHVDRRLQQALIPHASGHRRDGCVGADHAPVPIDREGGVRRVRA